MAPSRPWRRFRGWHQRIQKLRTLVTSAYIALAVAERDQRLLALQERCDGLRQARLARAAGDYDAMMRTDFVCRRVRWIGGKDGREVEEYEIDTAPVRVDELGGEAGCDRDRPGARKHSGYWSGDLESHCLVEGDSRVGRARAEDGGGHGGGEGRQSGRGTEMNDRRVGLGCRPTRQHSAPSLPKKEAYARFCHVTGTVTG